MTLLLISNCYSFFKIGNHLFKYIHSIFSSHRSNPTQLSALSIQIMTMLPPLPSKSIPHLSEKFDEGLEELDAQRVMSILSEIEKKFALLGMLPQSLDKKVTSVLTIDTVFLLTVSNNTKL